MTQPIENTGEKFFIRYRLTADCLCLGERTRGGIFRPCSTVFRYYGLVEALKARLGSGGGLPICAVGRFLAEPVPRQVLTFAPRDRVKGVSTVPLQVEYIPSARADIYVVGNTFTKSWPAEFQISLGALTSKGLGHCTLRKTGCVPFGRARRGQLCVRIPEDDNLLSILDVKVRSPIYGYLFKSTSPTSGVYVRSLFEGSLVEAPAPLLKEVQDYAG